MSTNPYVRTIHTLNTDILSYIFALNADMFSNDIEDLHNTTRITSQVCQHWRNLMLATPSLWARLIDMDILAGKWNIEWADELIRRSGAALLWIRVEWTCLATDIAEFLLRVIGENWHRIQKLIVQDQHISFDFKLVRLVFGLPAPHLETFDMVLDDTALEDSEGAPLVSLFGGHAPMLRRFHLSSYDIDQREPWLRQLHSLVLDGAYNTRDTLAVLAATPILQELTLYTHDKDYTCPSLPVMFLPHLKSLKCTGLPHSCTTLLNHIEIPLGCSLEISIVELPEYLDLEETKEQPLSAVDTFIRYSRRFLQSNIFQIVCVIYLPNYTISITGKATFPVECQYEIHLSFNKQHAPNQLAATLRKLALLDFSGTTTLELTLHGPLDPSFFSCLSSLDTLSVDERSLGYLMDIQDNINAAETEPHMLFPLLKVLDMDIYGAAVRIQVVERFILSRMQNGHPITTLNLTKCGPFESAPNLDALSEGKGLKVRYKLAEMDGTFEQVCDSGDPARHIVTV